MSSPHNQPTTGTASDHWHPLYSDRRPWTQSPFAHAPALPTPSNSSPNYTNRLVWPAGSWVDYLQYWSRTGWNWAQTCHPGHSSSHNCYWQRRAQASAALDRHSGPQAKLTCWMGLWDWDTKKRYFHTNFVHFFEAVNYHTKTTKKTKQNAFHTDLINWHTK